MCFAVFEQATGLFIIEEPLPSRYVGYSGRGIGRNNPGLQSVQNTGPIPAGVWRVGPSHTHERLGPFCFGLSPVMGTDTFGRSGFFIHGDNAKHDASHGCIVLPREARQAIAARGVTHVHVVRLIQSAKVKFAA